MSKLPILITMPRFNLPHYRSIFSLLKNPKNSPKFRNTHLHQLLFNRISPSPKPHFNSTNFTHSFSILGASTSETSPSSLPKKNPSSDSSSDASIPRKLPDNGLKKIFDRCSKFRNLKKAIKVYDSAMIEGRTLNVYYYNILLYLCALSVSNDNNRNNDNGSVGDRKGSGLVDGVEKGFELFKQMGVDNIKPNEATFTSMARLAAAKGGPEMAFDLVREMKKNGISPKLRSYLPALHGFCEKGDADGAYRVDDDMMECGVMAEESELCALLKVSVDAWRGDKVYEILHRLRASVRQVSVETVKVVKEWFLSEAGSGVGVEEWDVDKVMEGVVKGGGGWHGQGWLGSGKWNVAKVEMNEEGVCCGCGEKLVCIDIDPKETENFATDLSLLACKKETESHFLRFKEWLHTHGPFDAVVDGANVGMVKSQTFNHRQLIKVVHHLQNISPSKKLPLVILHRTRVYGKYGEPLKDPKLQKIFKAWMKAGILYTVPLGSNDDWYWLYAAVSNKCLLVTNDEMRDHLFQLLGNSIFPRWKEKHQVRMTVSSAGIKLHMPPPYSVVIQESEQGSWHVPTVIGDDLEMPKQWLCATRATET